MAIGQLFILIGILLLVLGIIVSYVALSIQRL